jgi:MscS family membrane protein
MLMRLGRYRLALLIVLALLAQATYAQLPVATTPNPPAPEKPAEQDPFGRDTPHGCVLGFLRAAERGDYTRAGQYLDVQGTPAQAQELARQLQVVLNHGLSGNFDDVSRAPEGDLKDGLRNNRDQAGSVKTSSGQLSILLDRVQRGTERPIWLFSSETLHDVPRVFQEFNAPGIERFVPRVLKEVKLFSLPLYRWLGIILSLALALFFASLVTRALIPLLRPLVRRMAGREDDRYLFSLRGPIRLVMVAIAIRVLADFAISLLARNFWSRVSAVVAIVAFSWLLIRFSDIVSDLSSRQLLRMQATGQIAVLALAHRLFKILVLFVAVALLLKSAGVNVSGMLAGLGIGGIALALAAQKTLEDLFGGIAIITRKAVRVGDFCQLADKIGTIEDIGLSSTRVRTLDRTTVSIPNGKLSQMNLENYSMRDKIWFHHIFGLRSDTLPEQMREVLSQTTQMLRDDRRVDKESARIRLIEFGPSSLKVEIFAYIKTKDYTTFVEIQEDLLLRIMDIIAACGTSIALPSQLTYLGRDEWSARDKVRPIPDIGEQGDHIRPAETLARPEAGIAHSAGEP